MRLALSLLTPQVCLINIEDVGEVEFYTGFVNCIVTILSERLVIQAYCNETLPDMSICYKNSRGRVYHNLTLKPSQLFINSVALAVYTRRTD